jgi:integrase
MPTWTAPQLAAFLDSVADDRLHPLWLCYSTTAARRGELLGLRWDDVDLDAARVAIRTNRTSVAYEVVEGTPKTAGSARSIDLDGPTVAALRRLRKTQLEERLAWGPAWTDTGLVFTREDSTGLHPDCVGDAFERAVKRAVKSRGLPYLSLHGLRHTWATLALKAGVNIKVVSERLGHSSVAFTMARYQHAIPGMQADAASAVAGLIFGEQSR